MSSHKIALSKPVLICLYGFPGSGKSYVARNLASGIQLAHVSGDRIRSELFENPRYDNQENAIITHLMNYMTDEFLSAGVSVVYDTNSLSFNRTLSGMQNPQPGEDYLVISGKHTFTTQKNAVINRLYQTGLITSDGLQHNVTKPGLVNLVPNPHAGRVDMSRRNIVIR
jgi:nucleoside diphosphate kinase